MTPAYEEAMRNVDRLVARALFPYQGTGHEAHTSLVFVALTIYTAVFPTPVFLARRLVWCSARMHGDDEGFSAFDVPTVPHERRI